MIHVFLYEADYLDGKRVRVYDQEEYWHSAAYTEEGRHFDLVFEYMKKFCLLFEHMPGNSRFLMLGSGGYSYPKYIISRYPEAYVTTVDPDPAAEESAKAYFYLDELIEKYDLEHTGRLISVTADGRDFLEACAAQYDVIINDAFIGGTPVFDLSTAEAFLEMKRILTDCGMAVVNVPGYKDMERSQFLKDTVTTAREVFRYVSVVPAAGSESSETCNYVMFASDRYETVTGQLEIDTASGRIMFDCELEEIADTFDF